MDINLVPKRLHFNILLFVFKLALFASFKVNYSLIFELKNEARANLNTDKRIPKCQPFCKKFYKSAHKNKIKFYFSIHAQLPLNLSFVKAVKPNR